MQVKMEGMDLMVLLAQVHRNLDPMGRTVRTEVMVEIYLYIYNTTVWKGMSL